jgi:hypothetical protein
VPQLFKDKQKVSLQSQKAEEMELTFLSSPEFHAHRHRLVLMFGPLACQTFGSSRSSILLESATRGHTLLDLDVLLIRRLHIEQVVGEGSPCNAVNIHSQRHLHLFRPRRHPHLLHPRLRPVLRPAAECSSSGLRTTGVSSYCVSGSASARRRRLAPIALASPDRMSLLLSFTIAVDGHSCVDVEEFGAGGCSCKGLGPPGAANSVDSSHDDSVSMLQPELISQRQLVADGSWP